MNTWGVGVAALGALIAGYNVYYTLANPELSFEDVAEAMSPVRFAYLGAGLQVVSCVLLPGVAVAAAVVLGGMPVEWLGVAGRSAADLALGAGAGVGLFALAQASIVAVEAVGLEYETDVRAVVPEESGAFLATLPAFALWAAAEEVLYRGVLVGVGAAALGVSPWVAVVVVAVGFGLAHLPHGRGSVPVTTLQGLGWGALFVVGGLPAAAAAHAVVNVGEVVVNGWLDAELRPDLQQAG